jgi:hypothetical protein
MTIALTSQEQVEMLYTRLMRLLVCFHTPTMTTLYFHITLDGRNPKKGGHPPRNLAHEPKDKKWSPSQYIVRVSCNRVETMHEALGDSVLMVH